MALQVTLKPNPYITIDELVNELKLKAEDVTPDAQLTADLVEAINNASRWIDDYQKKDYFQHDFSSAALEIDQTYPDCIDDTLFLPYSPIIELNEVKLGDNVLTLNTDFAIKTYKDGGAALIMIGGNPLFQTYLRQRSWSPYRPSNIVTIKGKFGYAQTTPTNVPTAMPEHIRLACRWIAADISGHNKKEIVMVDGSRESVKTNSIRKQAIDLLGRKKPVIM